MDWEDILAAFALYLILEGLIPFFNPLAFKRFLHSMATVDDSMLRYIGLGSMIAGVILLYLIRR